MELEKKLLEHYWSYGDGQSRVADLLRDLENIQKNPILLHLIVKKLGDQNIDLKKTYYYIEVSVYEKLEDKEYNLTIKELFKSIQGAHVFYEEWEKDYLKNRNLNYSQQRVFIKDHQIRYIKL